VLILLEGTVCISVKIT